MDFFGFFGKTQCCCDVCCCWLLFVVASCLELWCNKVLNPLFFTFTYDYRYFDSWKSLYRIPEILHPPFVFIFMSSYFLLYCVRVFKTLPLPHPNIFVSSSLQGFLLFCLFG